MRAHSIYLGIIAVLILILAYVSAKMIRAQRTVKEVEERFGLKDTARSSIPRALPLRKYSAADLLKPRTLEQYRSEIDALIVSGKKLEDFGKDTKLATACGKALEGGKRLRGAILMEIARAVSIRRQKGATENPVVAVDVAEVALFIEYIHSASLVVDDLPEFDNDVARRGRPSLHAEVGPAVAQMAALTLVASAFQNVCRQIDWIRDNCPEIKNVDRIGTRICHDVSRALGALGAAGGQFMDVASNVELGVLAQDEDLITDIIAKKTASFFEIATIAGWLTAGGSADQVDIVRDIGRAIGTAYQIADDIGDMESDAARAANGRPGKNFANEYGRDVATREMERHLKGAKLLLTQTSLWTPLWEKEIYPAIRLMARRVTPAEEAPPPESDQNIALAAASARRDISTQVDAALARSTELTPSVD
jgi:geranylgeranyl diphosphate synthase type II